MDVQVATADDDAALAGVLARAFADDPVQVHLVPRGDRRTRLAPFFAAELHGLRARGRVLTTDDRAGAALWAAPDGWRTPVGEVVRAAPAALRTFGRRLPRALDVLRRMEAVHPPEPHWYLAVLGTDPTAQGRGVGSALLRPVLAECDATGTPAYLESSNEDNLAFYGRHGFDVTGRIDLPGGPSLWPMWRAPVR